MVRSGWLGELTCLDMTIADDWGVKPQSKQISRHKKAVITLPVEGPTDVEDAPAPAH